jgi:hypothetical protein
MHRKRSQSTDEKSTTQSTVFVVDRTKLRQLQKLQTAGETLRAIREHWEREACELLEVPNDKSRISKLVKSILTDKHADICHLASEVQVWKANQAFDVASIDNECGS